MRAIAATFLAGGALALGGCGTPGSNISPLVPDKQIQLTSEIGVKLSTLVTAAAVAGVIYIVYDPFAPNWEIEEQRLNDTTYRLSMKMKRFHTGGAGESIQVFKRRAGALQESNGYGGYEIVEYTEGIDSQTLGAQRVAEGLIRLVRQEQTDAFPKN
ncbi:MAG: hypothetical protein FWC58_07230 [Desulfobulbus sp.]|nr:hypothetical protein [Desulfobulbus sp.]